MQTRTNTRKLVLLAVLLALTVILDFTGRLVSPGIFSITLALAPIVVGSALIGWWAGGILGLAFGATVLLTGQAAPFMTFSPVWTIIAVLLKGAAAGVASGLVYRMFRKINHYVAVVIAAIAAPIVNTGIFSAFTLTVFLPAVSQWGIGAGYENTAAYVFLGMIGINFLIEFTVNIVLSPGIAKLVSLGEKMIGKKE
ncbi:MAG: ECF transporter S component [Clostridiales bacterium]|nr:ECF transporter S component [Clostridiales bacterium]